MYRGNCEIAVDHRTAVGQVFVKFCTADNLADAHITVNSNYTFKTVAGCRLPIIREHPGLNLRQHDSFLRELWVQVGIRYPMTTQ